MRHTIRTINALFPKKGNKVMFASIPDFADNSRALYEYMISQDDFCNWSYVWFVKPGFTITENKNTRYIYAFDTYFSKGYFIYLYHVFTSRYLFCTHSQFVEANPHRQISVCLWHGTMLKRICAMNEREKNQPQKDQYRYFVSPSHFYDKFFCKSFLCKPEQVLTCGYPRNDLLFQDTDILQMLGIDRHEYNKIIIYMPTFRTPIGGGYNDSNIDNPSCINLSDTQSVKDLSTYLRERGVLFVIKWHPADTRQYQDVQMTNVISVSNKQLSEKNLQIYHLLHYADALITDYSSVYCDYMILDRPIAFDISDINSYADNRGFVFDKPLDYMPGYFLKTSEDILKFIDDIVQDKDQSYEKRHDLAKIYNEFEGGLASERLMKSIMLKLK